MAKYLGKARGIISKVAKNIRANDKNIYRPAYRVINIEKNNHNDYEITIGIIGKNTVFKMKPEEILSDDKMTDMFSPRDVRTLTYLGYLDINSPQYQILAQRLSEKNNMVVFCLNKKGSKKTEAVTANKISKEIIEKMDQKDAHMVGYALANEAILTEKLEKAKIISQLETQKQNRIKTAEKEID